MNILDEEKKLAQKLVNYSCNVQREEKVLIEYSDCSNSFVNYLIKEILDKGAYPFTRYVDRQLQRNILINGNEELFSMYAKYDAKQMQDMDAVILIKGARNEFEYSDVNPKQIQLYNAVYNKPVHHEIRVNKKWVLLRYPTKAFAQSSRQSTESFTQYFFDVCNLDYSKMCNALENLKQLMEKTDVVRILAPNTDLTFSIKGIPAIKCCGECNIPDGEIYTAPVKNSINGQIQFNIPAVVDGKEYTNILLKFKDGKIIEYDCNDNESFKEIIEADDGSSYMGEFAFGINPYVDKPIGDILFDEKMNMSIHMAIGCSYDDAYNGNKSSVHLDLIQSHKISMGGGEIYFDKKLIRKNGEFILPKLVAINKQNLL